MSQQLHPSQVMLFLNHLFSGMCVRKLWPTMHLGCLAGCMSAERWPRQDRVDTVIYTVWDMLNTLD
jgi:hypothetical protein